MGGGDTDSCCAGRVVPTKDTRCRKGVREREDPWVGLRTTL